METSKITTAYERFRWAAKEAERLFDMPLVVQYSGGKDSDVILQLAKESGVPFRVTHNLTTADPPDNVYYIRRVFSALREEGIDAVINLPKRSLWKIMRETLVIPSRLMRVCCSELKERKMPDAPYIVTGVRWAESVGRRAKSAIAMVHTATAPHPTSARYTGGGSSGCERGATHYGRRLHETPLRAMSDEGRAGAQPHHRLERRRCVGLPPLQGD